MSYYDEIIKLQETRDRKDFRIIVLAFIIGILTSFLTGCSENASAIDIDISSMPFNMRYAGLVNVYENLPDNIDKTLKITGIYHKTIEGDKAYNVCIIADELGCCSVAIEFESGTKIEDGATITIQGTISTYEENGDTFCTLKGATVWVQ